MSQWLRIGSRPQRSRVPTSTDIFMLGVSSIVTHSFPELRPEWNQLPEAVVIADTTATFTARLRAAPYKTHTLWRDLQVCHTLLLHGSYLIALEKFEFIVITDSTAPSGAMTSADTEVKHTLVNSY